jgi:hypothetical protein
MSGSDYIPRTEADFDKWQNPFVLNVSENAARYGISGSKTGKLAQLQSDWTTTYQLASDPATRTKAIIEKKNEARDNLVQFIRELVRQHLTYNDAVTNADRDNLGLPIHKTTHTPVPVPTDYPGHEVDTHILRQLIIRFFVLGGKHTSAKPFGVHGVELLWAILAAPPTRLSDLTHSSFATHSPITLAFEEDQRGKTLYYCLRWENTRGQKGPATEIFSIIIP